MNKFKIALITAFSLFVSVSYSQQHPDFSGEWILNISESRLQAKWTAGLEKGIVKIVHNEPDFRYWRIFIIKGNDDILTFNLQTAGQEKVEGTNDRKTISSLSWKQDTLLYITRTILGRREAINIARYYLINNDSTLVTDEKFTGPKMTYNNLWVFDKK
jgi:hypothetical protein